MRVRLVIALMQYIYQPCVGEYISIFAGSYIQLFPMPLLFEVTRDFKPFRQMYFKTCKVKHYALRSFSFLGTTEIFHGL